MSAAVFDLINAYRDRLSESVGGPAARMADALGRIDSNFRPPGSDPALDAVGVLAAKVLDGQPDILAAAISAAPRETESLAAIIDALADHVTWCEGPRPGAPAGLEGGYAYSILVGPDGHVDAPDCRMGVYLQPANVYYPGHAHDAEEFYLIVSGSADWTAGERRFTAEPGHVIHHAPAESHVMTTTGSALLACWAWQGDIGGEYWFT
jgi:hypothetical protein